MTKPARRLIFLIALTIVALLPMSTVHAASFTVGTAAELIAAINSANGNAEADTITLTADIVLTEINNTTGGTTGLPVITSDITIEGNGYTITRDGSAANFRILYVNAPGDLTLNRVTISNGRTVGWYGGGGIFNDGGTVTLRRSTLDGNYAPGEGGGIYNNGGTVTVVYSTVSDNQAGAGGGLVSRGGALDVSWSLIAGNAAVAGTGGGITSFNSATVAITNSTIGGNTASSQGGGLRISSTALTLTHVTLAGNSAPVGGNLFNDSGSVSAVSSIIADPVSGGNCSGAITDNGGNLEAESSGSYTCPATFAQSTTSGLQSLADNGGPTETMALAALSPAVDGTGAACGGAPTNGLDQRGYPRDALCDIGAFEYYDRSISGWVWFDTDGDGIQDAGEVPGVGGVNVTLNPGGLVATTNSQGYYVFAGLPAGSYTATFSNLPADYGFTLQNQGGSDDLDSDPDPATGTTQAITLGSPPDNEHNWDAGIIPSDLTVTKSNSVGGNTWDWTLSINNNGSADMTFNASEVILVDELPAGPTYPAAAAVTLTGATGTMTCPIAAGVLTCTAATPVTIGYSGSIEVEIGGITADAGQYANSTGVCTVDPNDVVDEDDETNNDCNTDVITVLGEGTVQGSGGSGHGSVSTTTTVVTVTESAPEYITIAVDNPAAAGGETVTYTITAYNPKNIPLTDVVIYDIFHDLLGDFQIVSNTHGTAIISNDTLIVNGFTLQPGETATIIVTAIISDDYRAGDVIPNVAVLESPDASIHVSNLILIGDIANRSDGDSVSVMVMPGKLPETGGDLLATGDEPNRRGWIYALAGVALLIAAGWIVQRRLASRSAG